MAERPKPAGREAGGLDDRALQTIPDEVSSASRLYKLTCEDTIAREPSRSGSTTGSTGDSTSGSGSGSGGLTYRGAGVDIDAGGALVEAIKPLARSTARPGANAALGGFGGLFDLKAAGYRDPLLVAATDGVGTKLKIAILAGKHDTIGIDLVAMCVNDLVVQGAEPLIFLDYFGCGRLRTDIAETVVAGLPDGCRQAESGGGSWRERGGQ